MVIKPIPNYEGLYSATDDGQIYSEYSKKFLKQRLNRKGYWQVSLRKDGKTKTYETHRLIAITFLKNPNNLPCVNHISENKTNNCINNLEWCTYKYNINYGTANARRAATLGRPVYCKELDKTFSSISEAAREIGVNNNCLNYHLNKNNGECCYAGYHFKYTQKGELIKT